MLLVTEYNLIKTSTTAVWVEKLNLELWYKT